MNTGIQHTSGLDLPQILVDFLMSNTLSAFNGALASRFGLSDDQKNSICRLQSKLLLRQFTIENFADAVQKELVAVDAQTVHQIVQDIFNEFCAPVAWMFPDIKTRVEKMGFVYEERALFPVAQPKTSLAEAVSVTVQSLGDVPRAVKEKIEKIVTQSLQGQYFNEDELRKYFLKSVTDGGIGLGEKNTNSILTKLDEYITVYAFSDIPDRTEWSAPKKELPPTLDPATIGKDILAPSEAIDLKVAVSAAEEIAASPLSAQQKSLVEAVLTAESLEDRSVDIQRRWKKIVEARIGGARDAEKTRVFLETAESAGGLGLNTDESQRLTQLLEQTASGFEKKREEFSVIEKIAQVKQQSEGVLAGPEAADRAHQNELNTRFVSMFGKNAVEEMRVETHREIESPETAHPGERASSHVAPLSFARPAAPSQPITEKAPTQQPSMEPKYVPKVPDKLRALIDAENPIFPLKTPAAPVQKKSSDIRPGMKLVGPIDELRTMSMVDFRRLSPDVSVRIQKIRSRIEVIAQDGPHEKIRAIQAFEQSDPVRLYRDVLKRSLISQRSSDDLRAEDKKAGKDYLEEDEILALRQFLTQIRYSSM